MQNKHDHRDLQGKNPKMGTRESTNIYFRKLEVKIY